VVYVSNNNANSNGGVAYANANNAATNTNANIGARLAIKTKKVSTNHGGTTSLCPT